jgi:prolyl oligopeptidase
MRSSCHAALLLVAAAFSVAEPPASKKAPVTDVYHRTSVVDDYRWLEDGNDKAVKAWSDAQNAHARSILDKFPGVEVLRKRITKIMTAASTTHFSFAYQGGQLFALRRQPPKQQPFLVVMPAVDQPDKARTLVDPNAIDKKGTTTIDWYVPSPDGKLVAVSLSKGGSESGDVHLYEVATAKEVGEVVPRVHGGTAGGDLAWAADGKGFFYTRYPRTKERPPEDSDFYQQLYYHELGKPTEKDRYELGKDLPRIAEIKVDTDRRGRLLVSVQNGDSGQFAHYLRIGEARFHQFSTFSDAIVDAVLGQADDIYFVSRAGAPRGKVLHLPPHELDMTKAVVVIPEGKDAIVTHFYRTTSRNTVLPMQESLYVIYQLGGPSELRRFNGAGKELPGPRQQPVSTVSSLTPLDDDDVLFATTSYVEPRTVHAFRPGEVLATTVLPLTSPPPVDLSDITVERKFAKSKDGTQVPVNILYRKGTKLDGKSPCLVTGYGGYALSMEPRYSPVWRVPFDHGFVIAIANLRGGSEFGEEWHKAGMLTRKQNVFDDFAAVLQFMIDEHYTSPERLAIQGGSNGGLLMGAILTQHPHLMKAVVSSVGIYDMLRVELSPNGAFNVPEYGTVKDPAQFRALHGYSPYHHVKDGERYPAVLFLTGANDPRVDPMQSRKMTARLQAASASGAPVLLRTNPQSGHGLDSSLSDQIEEMVDIWAFLFDQLGVKVSD